MAPVPPAGRATGRRAPRALWVRSGIGGLRMTRLGPDRTPGTLSEMSDSGEWIGEACRRSANQVVIRLQSRRVQVDPQPVPRLHDVLANNVRGERARRRMTQAQLADLLGWPRTAVHDVEVGRRRLTLDDLASLCAVFGLPLVELCRGADDEPLRALGLR